MQAENDDRDDDVVVVVVGWCWILFIFTFYHVPPLVGERERETLTSVVAYGPTFFFLSSRPIQTLSTRGGG